MSNTQNMSNTQDRISPQVVFGGPAQRILLIKLDHIGDFLISLPAFRRIRESFPHARITLVCGPWNRQLAQEVGLFDEIRTFSFFSEQSRGDFRQKRDPLWIATIHQRFAEIANGRYDLAADFRYDVDTRRLLTMVEAKYRAGIGDFAEFPFLDLAVPSDRHEVRQAPSNLEIAQFDLPFHQGSGVYWQFGRKNLRLEFAIHDPMSAIQIGTSTSDHRELGIALLRAKVTRKNVMTGLYSQNHSIWDDDQQAQARDAYAIEETIDFSSTSPAHYTLQGGWAEREPFGVWTEGALAALDLPLVVGVYRGLKLCLLVRGHTGPAKRSQSFEVSCGGCSIARATIDWGANERTLISAISNSCLDEANAEIVSDEFFVGYGSCAVVTEIETFGLPDVSGGSSLTFEAINALGGVLSRRTYAGRLLASIRTNQIEFVQSDPGLNIRLRIIVTGKPFSDGILFKSLRVTARPRKYFPTMHQLDWSGLVADMLIRRFATGPDLIQLPSSPLPAALQANLDEGRRAGDAIIVVATGSGKDVTMWPLDYYSLLVGKLLAALPCTIYMVGGSRDSDDAERIISENGSSSSVVNICGLTSLLELATLLKSTDLFIGNSSGAAHLSAMSGAPTLTIQSGTNHSHQWGPVGPKAFCLSLEVPCNRCHIIDLSQCSHGYRCMTELTPDIVFQQACSMLPKRSARHAVIDAPVKRAVI
jgi:ADP-heptose:LPS heptosyltransferase